MCKRLSAIEKCVQNPGRLSAAHFGQEKWDVRRFRLTRHTSLERSREVLWICRGGVTHFLPHFWVSITISILILLSRTHDEKG